MAGPAITRPLRLGIQNLSRRLSIIIGPAPHGQFLPVRLKIHMPFKKVSKSLTDTREARLP
jgi:hypothetical protein